MKLLTEKFKNNIWECFTRMILFAKREGKDDGIQNNEESDENNEENLYSHILPIKRRFRS